MDSQALDYCKMGQTGLNLVKFAIPYLHCIDMDLIICSMLTQLILKYFYCAKCIANIKILQASSC